VSEKKNAVVVREVLVEKNGRFSFVYAALLVGPLLGWLIWDHRRRQQIASIAHSIQERCCDLSSQVQKVLFLLMKEQFLSPDSLQSEYGSWFVARTSLVCGHVASSLTSAKLYITKHQPFVYEAVSKFSVLAANETGRAVNMFQRKIPGLIQQASVWFHRMASSVSEVPRKIPPLPPSEISNSPVATT